jgi:hypothetical protein
MSETCKAYVERYLGISMDETMAREVVDKTATVMAAISRVMSKDVATAAAKVADEKTSRRRSGKTQEGAKR